MLQRGDEPGHYTANDASMDGARIEWAEYFPTSQHTISYSRWFDWSFLAPCHMQLLASIDV